MNDIIFAQSENLIPILWFSVNHPPVLILVSFSQGNLIDRRFTDLSTLIPQRYKLFVWNNQGVIFSFDLANWFKNRELEV